MSSKEQKEEVHGHESNDAEKNDDDMPQKEEMRFSSEEEAALLNESNEQKAYANKLFGSTRYSEAIQQYDKALSTCPNYLEYEVAVLRSNIAACHLKLGDWKMAVEAATASLEGLDRLETALSDVAKNRKIADKEVEEEDIVSPGAARIGSTPTNGGPSKDDRSRIRAKVLMRRAKARTELGGWSALVGAEEDYNTLSTMPNLPIPDKKIVTQQLRSLPPRIEAAKQKDLGEMMSKLKELGNGILKPFGLSTENFNMVKDESSGGYSFQFNQGGKQ